MTDINLLPQDLKPKGYALKYSGTLKKVEFIAFSAFLICLIVVVGVNFAINFQHNRVNKVNESLKSEINTLEETEQKLVLIQDRINKIKKIETHDSAYSEALVVESILQNLPKEVLLDAVLVEQEKSEITVSSQNSSDLTKFFTYVANSTLENVDLVAFKYDIKSGYEVKISIKS